MNIGYKVTQPNHTLRFLLCIMLVYENIFADEIFISETLPKHMHDV